MEHVDRVVVEHEDPGADIRLTIPDGVAKLQAALDEKIKNRLIPDTEVTVKITAGRPPAPAPLRSATTVILPSVVLNVA